MNKDEKRRVTKEYNSNSKAKKLCTKAALMFKKKQTKNRQRGEIIKSQLGGHVSYIEEPTVFVSC